MKKIIRFKIPATLTLNLGLGLLLLAACGDNTATPTSAPTKAAATTAAATAAPNSAAATTAAPTTIAATTSGPATATSAPTTAVPTTVAPTTLPVTTAASLTTVAPTSPTTAETTAAATTTAPVGTEQEITFTSQKDTIYGSLLTPDNTGSGKLPVAIILAGSGPTDRDGNSTLIQGKLDTLKNFAQALAATGVASLRYDKLGTGKTGLASYASHLNDIDFQLYVDEAEAAYQYVKSQPQFDPQRIMVLGHSEGGLIALILADKHKAENGIKALTLASPLSRPYLDTIHAQLAAQYAAAVKSGAVPQAQADTALAELDQIDQSLLTTGKYPATITTAALKQIFTAGNEKFFGEVAKYDPQKIAAGLPAGMPVLSFCGSKDQQVSCDDVSYLMQGFQTAKNDKAALITLDNVDHVYKEVPGTPNPATDYGNPNLKFSAEAAARLADFVKSDL